MQTFYIEESDYQGNRKLYTKVGVLPFVKNESIRDLTSYLDNLVNLKIDLLINDINSKIIEENPFAEVAGIFSGYIGQDINFWKDSTKIQKKDAIILLLQNLTMMKEIIV